MTTTINKKQKNPNVPNLRFPEFSGEWMHSTIGSEFDLYSGNTPNRLNKEQFKGDVNWISSGELKEHYISETKEKITQEAANNNNLKLLPIGTFVIAIYGLEAEGVRGTCSITRGLSTISQACMAFTPIGSITNEFLYSWYKKHGNLIGIKYAQGTKQQNLSYDIISQFRIDYPQREEQVKLERFISLLDERIATQNKIIEKLQSLIKGLSISLTTKENPNTVISQCLECHSSTLQESEVLPNGLYKVFGASGLIGYTNNSQMSGEAILIIKDGSGVGTTSYAQGEFSVIGTLNYLTVIGNYDLRYLYFALSMFNFQPYKIGMAIPHIYFKDYSRAKIYCPSFTEQKRIANVLGKVESKLLLEQELIMSFNQQKRYLLSQMFI